MNVTARILKSPSPSSFSLRILDFQNYADKYKRDYNVQNSRCKELLP